MGSDLLITINANAANAKKAFDDIKDQTDDLEESLKKGALISGVAFAALTAEIYESVKAFNDHRGAALAVSQALQNQGIYTDDLKDKYREYAEAVEKSTGVDADKIGKSQALLQGFIGQTEITKELTEATVNLGAKMGGDLNGAAELIGKTVGTNINAFRRQGLVMSSTATEAEKMTAVLEFLNVKNHNAAANANEAAGGTIALGTAFDGVQKAIGERFAPAWDAVVHGLTTFFNFIKENPVITNLAVSFIAAAAAVTGIAKAAAVAVPLFLTLSAAAAAVGVSMNAAFFGLPAVIALVVGGITLLAMNWTKSMAAVKAAAVAVITLVTELFKGWANVLLGFNTLDLGQIKKGIHEIGAAFGKAKDAAVETYKGITAVQQTEGTKQDANAKALADKLQKTRNEDNANAIAAARAALDVLRLENEHASSELIAIKQKEAQTLKAITSDKTRTEVALLRERLAELRGLEAQQRKEDLEKNAEFEKAKAAAAKDAAKKGMTFQTQLKADTLATIKASQKTEEDIDRDAQAQLLQQEIDANNAEMAERKQFGATMAAIDRELNSAEVAGAKTAAGNLAALQQSKNNELKAIGKAGALAQIAIDTPVAAMATARGLDTAVPLLAPAIGFAGAAAVIAYGAERAATVVKAADGGLLTGGTPGVDSIPMLGMAGELVVPTKNFDEVVGATQAARSGDSGGGFTAQAVDLLKQIAATISAPNVTTINGDVSTDDSYIDTLVKKISDAVQYRNARIYGVTA